MLDELSKADVGQHVDPRIYYWLGEDYEAHECFRAAFEWYNKALAAGIKKAEAAAKRCENPYNVDPYYNISGQRGDGTHYAKHFKETKDAYLDLYKKTLCKLEDNPSSEENKKCLDTIYLLATARICVVPNAKTFIGDMIVTNDNNYAEASRWYKDAAENGDAEGARKYAALLLNGEGVEKNENKAAHFLEIAEKLESESSHQIQKKQLKKPKEPKEQETKKESERITVTTIRKLEAEAAEGDPVTNQIIIDKYREIVENYQLTAGKENACIKELFPHNSEFCDRAYQYCQKQYRSNGIDKLAFEMCMTPFYGGICCVALWYKNKKLLEDANVSLWNVLTQHVDVDIVDAEAERYLKTKQGDELAERIYEIISEYMTIIRLFIVSNSASGESCMLAMKQAYILGLRVAVAEFEKNVSLADNEQEHIAQKKSGSTQQNKDNPMQVFYSDCIEAFHREAQKYGVANRGVLIVPELLPRGEKVVLSFLQDSHYQSICNNNATMYYYLMFSLSIQAGIVLANAWNIEPDALDECEAEIIIDGPADKANELLEELFDKSISADQGNGFYQRIFPIWLKQHEPYWKLSDPRDYTYNALLAAYQLGVSMMLEYCDI